MCGGGIDTTVNQSNLNDTKVLAKATQGSKYRDIAVLRKMSDWKGGSVYYVRGTNSASYAGGTLLSNDDPEQWFTGGSLMRYGLSELGYSIFYKKHTANLKNPVNCISRNNNSYNFSGYVPNQTVEQKFKFPAGAPIFTGMETELKAGFSTYRFPKSWNKECRVFVEQQDGIVSCKEMAPVEFKVNRKIEVSGLKDATIRIYPGTDLEYYKAMPSNNHYPQKQIVLDSKKSNDKTGTFYEYKNITGQLVVTW